MNILYCGDSKIREGLITSILSLLKHVKKPLNIFVLTAKITQKDKQYLPVDDKTIEVLNHEVKKRNSNSSVTKIDITYLFNQNPPRANMNTIFTPNCMLRLYADQLVQIPSRILYLDADVMCVRDFSEYYYQDLSDHEICGTLDHYGKWWFHHDPQPFDYLNSGVLLLNIGLIRQTGLFEKCRNLCRTHWMLMPDQSAINKLCHTKLIVGDEYNEQHELNSKTVFRHFSTSLKFWPVFHLQTVKPWNINKLHNVLHEHTFDDVLDQYIQLKKESN